MDATSPRTGPAQTDDDPRWAEAVSVLHGAPSSTAERLLRRSRLLRWSWALAGMLLAVAAGVLLAVLAGASLVPDPGSSGGWVVAGLVVQGAGLAVMIGYLVVAWRIGLFRIAWWQRQPTNVLSRGQRRGLLAQVRGRAEVDPARLPLARDLAQRLVLQQHQALLVVGVVLQQLGRTIGAPTQLNEVITVLVGGGLVVAAVLMRREAGRAERFLADHPDPGSPV
ncbi:hypothetical protein IN07_08240 [Modestobacter caceresii]|uniref:Uncharacterized protein n=1 Tax=Modestobacter caceresii TaxID=1522368 RepID=A0A098Y9T3_9ACTN|nr:hypothetical protein [Modestobacter caceresii]KGH47197.1 hypothetical protein IN07_08240 [Modestobacter caceresii]